MRYIYSASLVILALFIYSCKDTVNKTTKSSDNKTDKVAYIYQNDKETSAIRNKGASIVKQAELSLKHALEQAIKSGGPENAIDFCNQKALHLTDSIAKLNNVTIKRLAKKYRNPVNETNNIESNIYKQYVIDWLASNKPEPRIAINSNGNPVYYKPIYIKKKCLTCHGIRNKTMPDNIADKISKLYPNDKAINFKEGYPRGMWAITFPNIKLTVK